MEADPIRVAEILVGLGDGVVIVGVEDDPTEPLRVHVRLEDEPGPCGQCGGRLDQKDLDLVELVDLAAFGRPTRLVWHKRRWRCHQRCGIASVTEQRSKIAPARHRLTTRAGRWACRQVGECARPVSDIAVELGVDWHTVNDAVIAWGEALLEADVDRVGDTVVAGLDETLAVRAGPYRHKVWATTVADVTRGQLIDVVQGRDAATVCAWFADQPAGWVDGIEAVTMDMSSTYLKVANTMLPSARQSWTGSI